MKHGIEQSVDGGAVAPLPEALFDFATTDEQWAQISPLLSKRKGPRGQGRPSIYDPRDILDGILWKLQTKSPWRDLPKHFPPYRAVHKQYQHWRQEGVLHIVFQTLVTNKSCNTPTPPARNQKHAVHIPKNLFQCLESLPAQFDKIELSIKKIGNSTICNILEEHLVFVKWYLDDDGTHRIYEHGIEFVSKKIQNKGFIRWTKQLRFNSSALEYLTQIIQKLRMNNYQEVIISKVEVRFDYHLPGYSYIEAESLSYNIANYIVPYQNYFLRLNPVSGGFKKSGKTKYNGLVTFYFGNRDSNSGRKIYLKSFDGGLTWTMRFEVTLHGAPLKNNCGKTLPPDISFLPDRLESVNFNKFFRFEVFNTEAFAGEANNVLEQLRKPRKFDYLCTYLSGIICSMNGFPVSIQKIMAKNVVRRIMILEAGKLKSDAVQSGRLADRLSKGKFRKSLQQLPKGFDEFKFWLLEDGFVNFDV